MRYLKYVLVGAATLVLATSTGYTQTDSISASPSAGDATRGQALFLKYGCTQCHGTEGQGGNGTGPRLAPKPLPLVAFIKYVRAPAGVMPPYTQKGLKADQDLADIHAYLSTRATAVSP